MIQRRQTIYLLLIVILGTILFFIPVIQFTSPVESGIQRMFELGATGLVLLIYVWFGKHNVAREWDLLFGSCIPLICLVLTLMAVRGILKDEALVRAADRLR